MTLEVFDFSASEWGIIKHRLEAGEAVAESVFDETQAWPEEEIEAACEALLETGGKGIESTSINRIVLENCCELSTYFCGMDDAVACGEISKGERLNAIKAAKSLDKKLNVTTRRD